jgi:hypothetical protein
MEGRLMIGYQVALIITNNKLTQFMENCALLRFLLSSGSELRYGARDAPGIWRVCS